MCNCNKSASAVKPLNYKVTGPASSITFSSPSQSNRKKTRTPVPSPQKMAGPPGEINPESFSGETLADKCQTFAYVLGLENPVPEKVLIAAIEDKNYAQRLFSFRNDPYLYELLNNPPESLYGNTTIGNPAFSSVALIAKAGKALLNWGLAGFPTVSAATLKKREDACLACPNLVESTNVLQKFTATYKISDQVGNRTGNKSCAVCGCVIKNKIRLATDTCPEEDAATPGLNHWGEPLPPKE